MDNRAREHTNLYLTLAFVLDMAKEEIVPRLNQYGGEPSAQPAQLICRLR